MNEPIERLVEQFRRLPGIGVKSARRLAYHMVEQSDEYVREFVNAITEAKSRTCYCSVCCHLSTQDPCEICSDETRDHSIICVVETPRDVLALERSRDYKGLYHVLHGALSPLDGVGVEDIRIKELLLRLQNIDVKEFILADC